MKSVALGFGMIALLLGALAAPFTSECQPGREEMRAGTIARDEIHKSFSLSPGATIKLINVPFGSIVIEPTDASDAEVHIVRTAPSHEELACNRLVVEQSPVGLIFRGNENQDCKLQNTSIEQKVNLKLPRFVNITAATITGPLRIGEAEGRGPNFVKGADGKPVAQPPDRPSVIGKGFDGSIHIQSISGPVKLVQGSGETTISGVNGGVSIALRRFSSGLQVDGINGAVELQFANDLNANLEASNIRGEVKSQGTGVMVNPQGKGAFQAQIGAGGSPISISNIIGNVVLRRGQQ